MMGKQPNQVMCLENSNSSVSLKLENVLQSYSRQILEILLTVTVGVFTVFITFFVFFSTCSASGALFLWSNFIVL
jgi:hypothetical protein